MDVRFVASAITCMAADAFTEQLLDDRNEGLVFRQRKLREGYVGGF